MQLNGRLGNQLFLWAYAHELAKKFNVPVQPFRDRFHFSRGISTIFSEGTLLCENVLPLADSDSLGFILKVLDKIDSHDRVLAKKLEQVLNFERQRDAYELASIKKKPTVVTGYFINAKMVTDNSSHLMKHVEMKFDQLSDEKTYYPELHGLEYDAIHIRRGDYKSLSDTFGLLDLNWYMRNLDGKKPLVIATDDLEGSAEIIKSLNPDFVLDPKYVSPWQTLKILSTAKCLVLANSTFSWWAGYIGAEKGNSVVFPRPFYKSEPWRNDVLEFSGINPEIASFEE
jgi:hypothetical protein